MKEKFLSREELYQKIWEKPTTKLAKELGISDVALGKICRKLNVPKPPPGHWSKIQFGHQPEIPPLPDAAEDIPPGVFVSPTEKENFPRITDKKVLARIERERLPQNKIKVAKTLCNPHPLIARTKEFLIDSGTDNFGALRGYWQKGCLDIKVSKTNLQRALLLMNALVKAFEKRGIKIYGSKERRGRSWIAVGQVELYIKLREKFKLFEKELTAEEKKRNLGYNRYYYQPTGKFTFSMNGRFVREKHWRDTETRPLENQLNKIIAAAVESAEIINQEEIARLKEEKRRLEEERQREIEKQIWLEEIARRERLEKQALNWHKSQEIRAYLKACEEHLIAQKGKIDPESPEAKWLALAYAHADRLDPLKTGELEELIAETAKNSK